MSAAQPCEEWSVGGARARTLAVHAGGGCAYLLGLRRWVEQVLQDEADGWGAGRASANSGRGCGSCGSGSELRLLLSRCGRGHERGAQLLYGLARGRGQLRHERGTRMGRQCRAAAVVQSKRGAVCANDVAQRVQLADLHLAARSLEAVQVAQGALGGGGIRELDESDPTRVAPGVADDHCFVHGPNDSA